MKRILAILVSACVILAMIPASAFAEGNTRASSTTPGNITINVTDGYFSSSDFNADGSITENGSKKITVASTVNEGFDKDKYTLRVELNTDKTAATVTVTVNSDPAKYGYGQAEAFDVVSDTISNTGYFLSGKSAGGKESDFSKETYTGKEIKPTVYLYKEGENNASSTRIDSSNYTVAYSNNIAPGTAGITVTGKNTLRGTVTSFFNIEAATVTETSFTAPDKEAGNDVSAYDISFADITGLTKDTDYSLTIQKKNATGTYEDYTGDNGKFVEGEYRVKFVRKEATKKIVLQAGKSELYKAFSVTPKWSEGATVTVEDKTKVYSGDVQKPTITVKKGEESYVEGTDYTVVYKKSGDNKELASVKDAGEYSIILKAKTGGKLAGEKILEDKFTITQLALTEGTNVYTSSLASVYYIENGQAKIKDLKVYWKKNNYINVELKENTDYTVAYDKNTVPGTATATVAFTGNFTGSIKKTFTASISNSISSATVYIPDISDQSYTGSAIKPYLSVYYGGATAATAKTVLVKDVDYVVTYSNNISVGTGSVTVTGIGKYSGTITKYFKIKYNLTTADITVPATMKSTGQQLRPDVTVKVGTTTVSPYYYTIVYGENKYSSTSGTVTINTANSTYAMGTAYRTFTITGNPQTMTATAYEYDYKTTKSQPFNLGVKASGDGTGIAYKSSHVDVATVDSKGNVTTKACGQTVITAKTEGDKTSEPKSIEIKITVKPPTAVVNSVKSSSRGKLTASFEKVAAAAGNKVYYQVRYSRDKDFEDGTYKTSTFKSTKPEANDNAKKTVSGLKSGYRYYVKVRGYVILPDGSKKWGKWSKVKSVRVK